jgi:signal transduction histidine kinase
MVEITANCPLATELATRMRDARADLTRRWLERIGARVSMDPQRTFPSELLLDHIPILMDGIADYVETPADEISADVPVIAKAMELGGLRLEQGFDAHEILKEYEILGGVLFNFAAQEVEKLDARCSESEILTFSHRLFRAIAVIEQVTTNQYLRSLTERVNEREEQLRRFNRMVSHELKNKVGAMLGAGELVQEEWISSEERKKFVAIVIQNAHALQKVLDDLTELSKLEGDARRQRNIMLREAVTEVLRQQRELIRSREITIEIADDLPRVEVNAAAVELCLSNYLSNAVKYSDPESPVRRVRVGAAIEDDQDGGAGCYLVVRVEDNGVGVREELRDMLFDRFFRSAETSATVEGTGLGLSLVRETVEAIGGQAWAEFDKGMTVFAFSVPCRRREDGASSMIFQATDQTGAGVG